jgi:sensor domain CHASE-containing protein
MKIDFYGEFCNYATKHMGVSKMQLNAWENLQNRIYGSLTPYILEERDQLFEMLASYCGKTAKTVKKDADRDLWMSSEEVVKYGLVDEIITKKAA